MFEGIVLGLASVRAVTDKDRGRRLEIDLADLVGEVPDGGSVAINGTCLTSVGADGKVHRFDVIDETLQRTNLGELGPGDRVNVELPLRWGGEINGHLVQGHVDTTAAIVDQRREGDDVRKWLELPEEHLRYVVEKGSIALDGISLTVASLERETRRFSVALIPYTLDVTTLGFKGVGARLNIEIDHQAKQLHAAVGPHLEALRDELSELRARVAKLEQG